MDSEKIDLSYDLNSSIKSNYDNIHTIFSVRMSCMGKGEYHMVFHQFSITIERGVRSCRVCTATTKCLECGTIFLKVSNATAREVAYLGVMPESSQHEILVLK